MSAARGVPAGIVSMLVALSPILTYAGAVAFGSKRSGGRVCWASPSASSASRCWSCPRPACRRGPWCRGSLLTLLLPVGYATTSLATALLRPPATESLHFAFGYFFFGSLPLLAVVAATDGWWWFEGRMDAGEWALITSIFVQASASTCSSELIRFLGPVFLLDGELHRGAGRHRLGHPVFGERHSHWVWLALLFLLVGVFFVIQRRRERPAQAETAPD